MAHVVNMILAVFTAVRIGNQISTARIAFDSTHEWHRDEQKNRASVKDHHRPFWPSNVRALSGRRRQLSLGCSTPADAPAVKHKRAHSPDPQARGPLSLWTEVWPTHNLLLHRPLVGGGSRGGGAACCCCCSTQRAQPHTLRPPKHESRYHYLACAPLFNCVVLF